MSKYTQEPHETHARGAYHTCPVCGVGAEASHWRNQRSEVCPGEVCTLEMRSMYLSSRPLAEQARSLLAQASALHGEQRYAYFPYRRHLADAVSWAWLRGWVLGPELHALLLAVVAFHDTLEDTSTTEDTLRALIGERAAACVVALSDKRASAGEVDRPATWAAIAAAGPVAVAGKISDYASHLGFNAIIGNRSRLRTYVNRYDAFRTALRTPETVVDPLWDDLARVHARAVDALRALSP